MNDVNDPLGIGRFPKWVQVLIFVVLLVSAMVAVEYVKEWRRSSPEARHYKTLLEPTAEKLTLAEEVGDKAGAYTLLEPIAKAVRDYNDLTEARKNEINASSLRYCVLAMIHLSSGITEVFSSGYWGSKEKYRAAIAMCD